MDRIIQDRATCSAWRAGLTSLCLASIGLFSAPSRGADGERMASDQGCLNCHYSESRSSPTLQSLAGKLKRDAERQPAEQALQGMLREMRGQSGIHSHQMVTDESVLVILQWLAQGTTEG